MNPELDKALLKLYKRYDYYTTLAQANKTNLRKFLKYTRLASVVDVHINYLLKNFKEV